MRWEWSEMKWCNYFCVGGGVWPTGTAFAVVFKQGRLCCGLHFWGPQLGLIWFLIGWASKVHPNLCLLIGCLANQRDFLWGPKSPKDEHECFIPYGPYLTLFCPFFSSLKIWRRPICCVIRLWSLDSRVRSPLSISLPVYVTFGSSPINTFLVGLKGNGIFPHEKVSGWWSDHHLCFLLGLAYHSHPTFFFFCLKVYIYIL